MIKTDYSPHKCAKDLEKDNWRKKMTYLNKHNKCNLTPVAKSMCTVFSFRILNSSDELGKEFLFFGRQDCQKKARKA